MKGQMDGGVGVGGGLLWNGMNTGNMIFNKKFQCENAGFFLQIDELF